MPDYLTKFGFGGGSGVDSEPYQTMDNSWMEDMAAVNLDINGPGFFQRMDYTAAQNADGTWANTNRGAIERGVYWTTKFGGNPLMALHYANSKSDTGACPRVYPSDTMEGWMDFWTSAANIFFGPQCTVRGGYTVAGLGALPSSYAGCTHAEIWNEPNSIGTCGGVLNSTGKSFNGRQYPYTELMVRLNYDAAVAMQQHRAAHGNYQFFLSCLTTGAIPINYIKPIVDKAVAMGQNFLPKCYALSMHGYQNTNPPDDTGSATKEHSIKTVATNIRPYIDANGGAHLFIWITEGIGSGQDTWNQYNMYNGVEGVDKASLSNTSAVNRWGLASNTTRHKGTMAWGDEAGAGRPAKQLAGDVSQPQINRNWIKQVRAMNNATPSAKIQMVCPHLGMTRAGNQTDATTSNGYPAWQYARRFVTRAATDKYYSANSTLADRQAKWRPVAYAWRAERLSVTAATASFTATPTLNDTTPQVGQVLTVDANEAITNPPTTVQYQWQRDSVDITGATAINYTVVTADLGHQLRCEVTLVLGTQTPLIGNTAQSSAVTAASGIPLNQTPPVLGDPTPVVGEIEDTSDGTWLGTPFTNTEYKWERENADGTITQV